MPEVIKGTIYRPGSEWRSPLTGKVLLKIMRITDGTPDTTPTRQVYGRFNYAKGDFVRDSDGKIPKHVEDQYLEGDPRPQKLNLLKVHKLLPGKEAVMGDEKDVFVYYVEDPEVVLSTVKGEIHEKYISGHGKCSHDEFLAIIQKVEEQIAEEVAEAEAQEKEKEATIAAMTAEAIVGKIKTGKGRTTKKARKKATKKAKRAK